MYLNEKQERIHEFVIIIKRVPGANDQESNQEDNQESVQETHQETHQEMHQEKHISVSLTKDQLDIVNFCSVPRSAKEILERKGLYNQSRARKKYILSLVELGVLEMTIPEKPNDRNQKYRKRKK